MTNYSLYLFYILVCFFSSCKRPETKEPSVKISKDVNSFGNTKSTVITGKSFPRYHEKYFGYLNEYKKQCIFRCTIINFERANQTLFFTLFKEYGEYVLYKKLVKINPSGSVAITIEQTNYPSYDSNYLKDLITNNYVQRAMNLSDDERDMMSGLHSFEQVILEFNYLGDYKVVDIVTGMFEYLLANTTPLKSASEEKYITGEKAEALAAMSKVTFILKEKVDELLTIIK